MLQRLVLALALALPLTMSAQAADPKAGDSKAGTGCARFVDLEKSNTCVAKEQRAARDAERKRIDAQRRSERLCAAKAKDEKSRADCEKKEAAKQVL